MARNWAGDAPPGSAWLSDRPRRWPADALQVMIAAHNGNGNCNWGRMLEPYDVRFGNVFVNYGGHDQRLLERVKAAVADVR